MQGNVREMYGSGCKVLGECRGMQWDAGECQGNIWGWVQSVRGIRGMPGERTEVGAK